MATVTWRAVIAWRLGRPNGLRIIRSAAHPCASDVVLTYAHLPFLERTMSLSCLSLRSALCLTVLACGGEKTSPPPKADSAAKPAPAASEALRAGEARLAVDGGRIWYKVSGSGTNTALIMPHGGQGVWSFDLT